MGKVERITLIALFLVPSSSFALNNPSIEAQAAHLFGRLAFGSRPGEVEKLQHQKIKGVHAWIEEQLHPESINDQDMERKLASFKSLKMSPAELLATYKKPEDVALAQGIKPEDFKKNEELKKQVRAQIGEDLLPEAIIREQTAQRLIRDVESRKQLQEVVIDFWLNHFNIDISKGEEKWMLPDFERSVIRKEAFNKFGDLLRATTHSAAMLYYLDNQASESEIDYVAFEKWEKNGRKGAEPKHRNNGINENYARELLELHTLGVDGGYSQADVTGLARILTGWSIDNPKVNPVFKFKDRAHDRGEKTFLGQKFPAGLGIEEGERAIDLILQNPATARFICTKLARYFVADIPPQDLIDRMVKIWHETNGDLTAIYREIFESKEFWAKTSYAAKVKTPLQFVVSAVRAMGGELDVKNDLPKLLATLGEEPYRCAPPTGYKDTAETWVNPGAMIGRLNFSIKVAGNRIEGVYGLLPSLRKQPRSATQLIQIVVDQLLHEPLSHASQVVVLRQFEGQTWSMAEGEVRPINLTRATALILGSPEFQRR